MKKLWLQLKILFYVFKASRNPENTSAILSIGPILSKLKYLDFTLTKLKAFPREARLFESRHLMNPIDLKEHLNRPAGTLGAAYAQHMFSNNLKPDFFENLALVDDEAYFMMRMRQTHDLWHVMTGFTTQVEDEVALIAFTFAQTRTPLTLILLGAGLLRAGLTNDPIASSYFEKMSTGWFMGLKAQSLFAVDWESHWNTPLVELRKQYGLLASYPQEPALSL